MINPIKNAPAKNTRQKLSLAISAVSLLLVAASASAQKLDYRTALQDMKSQWSTVENFCTKCHNPDDFAGGVDFTAYTAESVAEHPDLFERALKKLRGSVMPPPSQKQPS